MNIEQGAIMRRSHSYYFATLHRNAWILNN